MVAPQANQRPTTERRIYFFRAYSGLDNAGRIHPFDPVPALQYLEDLPWNANGRYWIDNEGKVSSVWVDQVQPLPRLRLGIIRRSDLPQLEEDGNLEPLDIPEGAGLAEYIHAVFFENNIVGADYNFYGPRLSKLAYYLSTKANHLVPPILGFEPLLRQDVAEQLDNIERIRLFNLRIRPSFIDSIAQANQSLADGFRAIQEAGQAESLEITLGPVPRTQNWLADVLIPTIRQIIRSPSYRSDVSRFKVKGLDGESQSVVELDLLNDKLIAKKQIVKINIRSRALEPASAYSAIEEAYIDLRGDLEQAAGIVV